jgi:hypothetical protein
MPHDGIDLHHVYHRACLFDIIMGTLGNVQSNHVTCPCQHYVMYCQTIGLTFDQPICSSAVANCSSGPIYIWGLPVLGACNMAQ